jgi:predicted DCC family thiol-disulfide oxidoreductase YuxK
VRPTLIFDGDCAFCTRCVQFGEDNIPFDADITAWQFVDDLAEYGVDQERAEHEVLWVTPTGVVYGGADAVAKVLLSAGGAYAVLGGLMLVPPVRWAAHAVYKLIAKNRDKMPGGTAACALPAHLRPGASQK